MVDIAPKAAREILVTMADSFVIGAGWLDGIKNALGNVTSSGQAYAAISSALDFASDAADVVRGQSWLESIFSLGSDPDPWRLQAAADIDNAAAQLRKELGTYSSGGTTPIDRTAWSSASQKTLYVYSLAQVARKSYPADTDTSGIEGTMLGALGAVTQAILNAPAAVINYAKDLADTAVDAVGDVGRHAVKAAGGIVGEAATQVKGAAENLVPWGLVAGVVVIAAGAIFGLVYLSRTGTLKQVASLKAA